MGKTRPLRVAAAGGRDRAHPYFLIGSVDSIVDQVVEWRQRVGVVAGIVRLWCEFNFVQARELG
jgi:hypothetical protein